MAKDYKDATPAEKDASAKKMDSESWNPVDAAMKFVASKTGADKKVPPAPQQELTVKKMAKGGSASSRADGCCSKGKTRGKMM